MKIYTVSLCLSIEAENQEEAILEFYKKCNEIAFDRDSVDIVEELPNEYVSDSFEYVKTITEE